jgi:mannose-6-phosphate isomerase-like protein (cupin superfamily)
MTIRCALRDLEYVRARPQRPAMCAAKYRSGPPGRSQGRPGEGSRRLDTGCRGGGIIRFMTDGFVRGPGEGERVSPAMTLKVGDVYSTSWSMFEVADIGPGFDVGAHLHRNAEELFYVLEGQLDLLAFEPVTRTPGNWQAWQSPAGARVARGGPGSMMYVPRGCPHAFANPGPGPARMIFLVSPSGHELYQ